MDRLRPLDVIFTKPKRGFGHMVELGQKIHFGSSLGCHMHLLVNKDVLPHVDGLKPDKWYLLESNMPENDGLDPLDVVSGKYKDGVQIRDFQQVLDYNYSIGNRVFLSNLVCNPWDDPRYTSFIQSEMTKIFDHCYPYSYQRSPCAIGSSLFDTLIPTNQYGDKESDSVYCSQLVSICYRRLGIIKRLPTGRDFVAPQSLLANKDLFLPPLELESVLPLHRPIVGK